MPSIKEKKAAFFVKVSALFREYTRVVVVTADNVGSNQIQKIRADLRNKAVILFGKNTLIRRAMRDVLAEKPELESIVPHIKGNCGLVFTSVEMSEVKKVIDENKVGAPARAGVIAPNSVVVPAGPTGLEPTQTSFFQALNIGTKINRGQIEILQDVALIEEGTKVGSSEAVLLQKLDIRPFKFGLGFTVCYEDGAVFDAKVLDLGADDILSAFKAGVSMVTTLSLAIGYPTVASLPHIVLNSYKVLLSLAVAANYEFEEAKSVFAYLADPDAFVAAAAASAPAAAAAADDAAPAAAEEEAEESDDDMGFGLFD